MKAVADRHDRRPRRSRCRSEVSITADVGIGPIPGGFGIQVAMKISLPGMDHAVAEALVAKAHKVCPYSNATRGNIEVTLTVVLIPRRRKRQGGRRALQRFRRKDVTGRSPPRAGFRRLSSIASRCSLSSAACASPIPPFSPRP